MTPKPGCNVKVRYVSRHAALAGVENLRRNGKRGEKDDKFDVYQCMYCGAWHFGHRRERQR